MTFLPKSKGKNQNGGFRTKPEAELAAAEFLRKIRQGYEQIDMPLVDYIQSWISNYKEGAVRKNTRKQHENI
ncbi:Arm DNA-binding domain-containing protein [Paenibacillus brasilensis]|uniref:Arm DNA-binding domain-containing protein n=1 Tax=Paenibacillus brasilensis TaxID=128574 RepID=UPI003522C8D7